MNFDSNITPENVKYSITIAYVLFNIGIVVGVLKAHSVLLLLTSKNKRVKG